MILVNINFFSFAKILEFKKNEIRDIKFSKLIKLKIMKTSFIEAHNMHGFNYICLCSYINLIKTASVQL